MKGIFRLLPVVFLLLALSPLPARAGGGHHGGHHHGGTRVGVWIGPGFWWGPRWVAPPPVVPYPWAYRAYPYPAVRERVVVVEEPSVYVERSAAPEASSWWYYCESERAYYPEASRCPEGWVKVAPRPE